MQSQFRARLDGWVNPATGVLNPKGNSTDAITLTDYPEEEAARVRELAWCSPCGHVYYCDNIRTWMRGRPNPKCPECQEVIQVLVPYGMTQDDVRALKEAEAAATRARVAVARQEHEPKRERMIHERLVDEQEVARRTQELNAIRVETGRYRDAAEHCRPAPGRQANAGSERRTVLSAARRLCMNGDLMSQNHGEILQEYIQNLRRIMHLYTSVDDRWQMAFAMDAGVTIEEADGLYRGVLAEVETLRTQNTGILMYLTAIRDDQPHVLDAAAYVVFLDTMVRHGDVAYARARYVSALRGFVRSLEWMDRVRGHAGLPPRPAGQTVAGFLATVGRI